MLLSMDEKNRSLYCFLASETWNSRPDFAKDTYIWINNNLAREREQIRIAFTKSAFASGRIYLIVATVSAELMKA